MNEETHLENMAYPWLDAEYEDFDFGDDILAQQELEDFENADDRFYNMDWMGD